MSWLGVVFLVIAVIAFFWNVADLVKMVRARKSAAPCDDNNQEKEKK